MTNKKINVDQLKTQLQDTQPPEPTSKQKKQTSSARRIVDAVLTNAEKGNKKGINDLFIASVKKIREQSEADFLLIKSRYGAIAGLLASDLNKLTKIYRKKQSSTEGDDGASSRATKTDLFIELVRSRGTLFHNADDETCISYQVQHINPDTGESEGNHRETYDLRSKAFKKWSSYLFFIEYGTSAGDKTISEAIDVLSGIGLFEASEHDISLRYAISEGVVYVDQCNANWQAVQIDITGWKIIESNDLPVKFTRSSTSRPLPMPQRGGNINLLWDNINLPDTDLRLLVIAWLLECMRPNRPYPLMEIIGEQGSAKTTFAERLRELIDPNKVNSRAAPRAVEDIFVSTRNNHIISYNNLSHLSASVQDSLCTLSTGGGDSTRKLYTTTDEEVFEAMRPVILNGISQLATRPDLADRTIALDLPRINTYIPEQDLKKKWEEDQPLILGALYSLMSKVLAEMPRVRIDKPPRMADFARLGQALLNVMGIDDSFTDIYSRNRDQVVTRAIDASPVAQAVITMLNDTGDFNGTKGYLMECLDNYKPKYFDKLAYPKTVRGLGDSLRRIAPALRVRNIEVLEDKKRHKDGYRVAIRYVKPDASIHNNKTTIEI